MLFSAARLGGLVAGGGLLGEHPSLPISLTPTPLDATSVMPATAKPIPPPASVVPTRMPTMAPVLPPPTLTTVPPTPKPTFASPTPTSTPAPSTHMSTPVSVSVGTSVTDPGSSISPTTVSHLAQLARCGKASASQVTASPDGSLPAITSTFGDHVHDARTLAEVRCIDMGVSLNSVAFPPDGGQLALGGQDGRWHGVGVIIGGWATPST